LLQLVHDLKVAVAGGFSFLWRRLPVLDRCVAVVGGFRFVLGRLPVRYPDMPVGNRPRRSIVRLQFLVASYLPVHVWSRLLTPVAAPAPD
jgi:hypothetical protein